MLSLKLWHYKQWSDSWQKLQRSGRAQHSLAWWVTGGSGSIWICTLLSLSVSKASGASSGSNGAHAVPLAVVSSPPLPYGCATMCKDGPGILEASLLTSTESVYSSVLCPTISRATCLPSVCPAHNSVRWCHRICLLMISVWNVAQVNSKITL